MPATPSQPGGLGPVNEPALEAGYLGGRYYFQFRQVSDRFLNSQRAPVASYFACRLSAAVAVGPGAAWSLQMNAFDPRPDSRQDLPELNALKALLQERLK